MWATPNKIDKNITIQPKRWFVIWLQVDKKYISDDKILLFVYKYCTDNWLQIQLFSSFSLINFNSERIDYLINLTSRS